MAEVSQDSTRSPEENRKAGDTGETAGRWGTNTPQLQKPNNRDVVKSSGTVGFSPQNMITSSQVHVCKGRKGEEKKTP